MKTTILGVAFLFAFINVQSFAEAPKQKSEKNFCLYKNESSDDFFMRILEWHEHLRDKRMGDVPIIEFTPKIHGHEIKRRDGKLVVEFPETIVNKNCSVSFEFSFPDNSLHRSMFENSTIDKLIFRSRRLNTTLISNGAGRKRLLLDFRSGNFEVNFDILAFPKCSARDVMKVLEYYGVLYNSLDPHADNPQCLGQEPVKIIKESLKKKKGSKRAMNDDGRSMTKESAKIRRVNTVQTVGDRNK